MVFRHERGKTVWVDLEKPSMEEIARAASEFNLPEPITDELHDPSPFPFAAGAENVALLVAHFPIRDEEDDESRTQEIDFVVGPHFVLTVRYEVVPAFHALHKALEAHEILGVSRNIAPDELFELLVGKLLDGVRDQSKYASARLEKIERIMFQGHERETVRAISEVNREFLHLEAALTNNEEPLSHFLKSLARRGDFGPYFEERMGHILGERNHVARLVAAHRAIAVELQQTNSALLNSTQNEIMKTLTVVTFIFLPLELIAGIFAMDTTIPFIKSPSAFWYVVGAMLIVAAGLALFFTKVKRWL